MHCSYGKVHDAGPLLAFASHHCGKCESHMPLQSI